MVRDSEHGNTGTGRQAGAGSRAVSSTPSNLATAVMPTRHHRRLHAVCPDGRSPSSPGRLAAATAVSGKLCSDKESAVQSNCVDWGHVLLRLPIQVSQMAEFASALLHAASAAT